MFKRCKLFKKVINFFFEKFVCEKDLDLINKIQRIIHVITDTLNIVVEAELVCHDKH